MLSGFAAQVVSEYRLLFLSIGLSILALILFAVLQPWRLTRGRKGKDSKRAADQQSPGRSVPRNSEQQHPAKLRFHQDDDRSVTYDGKTIGFIVPNHSKAIAWAFDPVPGNGVIERPLRGRAQKDARSALRQAVAPISPPAAPRNRKRTSPKRRRSLAGADPSWTPLHRAAYMGRLKNVESLIATQAALNIRNKSGETPLDVADGEEVVAALVAAGAYRTRQKEWEL